VDGPIRCSSLMLDIEDDLEAIHFSPVLSSFFPRFSFSENVTSLVRRRRDF
jgi:hypothetical protein